MKLSDGFDARRLRPRSAGSWRTRLGAALAALLATFGILLSMAGIAALLGQHSVLGPLNESAVAASLFAVIGLALLLGKWVPPFKSADPDRTRALTGPQGDIARHLPARIGQHGEVFGNRGE